MGHKVKKIIKICVIVLLVIIAIPAAGYIALYSPAVQNKLIDLIVKEVSENLDTEIQIKQIDFRPFNRVILEGVYLQDLQEDTLLYANKLAVNLRAFNRKERELRIGKVELDQSYIRFYTDSTKQINFKFIIDKLTKTEKDTTKEKWDIKLNRVNILDSRFALQSFHSKGKNGGIDFSDLELTSLNIKTRLFEIQDSVRFIIRDLNFIEKSGFRLNEMESVVSLRKDFLHFDNVHINTGKSKILARKIHFDFNAFSDFGGDRFFQNVNLDCKFRRTVLSMNDLAYFVAQLKGYQQRVVFESQVSGNVSDLKAKNLRLEYGYNTELEGNLNMIGLPDFKETFIFFNLKNLETTMEEMEKLVNSIPLDKNVDLPEQYMQLGKVKYKGNFTGFANDFVAYGELVSNLGTISTDLSIKPDTSEYVKFKGLVKTRNFDLGKLIDQDSIIGKVSMNTTVNAYKKGNSIQAFLDGAISSLDLFDYQYQNILLKGTMSNKTYDGSIFIEDPNIKLDFLGNFDFSGEVPEFNFSAVVPYADLPKLNLVEKDTVFQVSGGLMANFKGARPDDIIGNLSLVNTEVIRGNKKFSLEEFTMYADSIENEKLLKISSSIFEAEIQGEFRYTELYQKALNSFYTYMPSFHVEEKELKETNLGELTLWANFKDVQPLVDLIYPGLIIAPESWVTGMNHAGKEHLELFFHTDFLVYKEHTWNEIDLNINALDSSIAVGGDSKNLTLKSGSSLENLSFFTKIKNNNLLYSMHWNNYMEPTFSGSFLSSIDFTKPEGYTRPVMNISILPAEFVFQDTMWTFTESQLIVDSSFIWFDNVKVKNGQQTFAFRGAISENPADTLFVFFNEFNMGQVSNLFQNSKLDIDGILSGKASVSDVYKSPIFTSDLHVDDLVFNGEKLGQAGVQSKWNARNSKLQLSAFTKRGRLKTIDVKGEYEPRTREMDFDIELDKLFISIFNPYTSDIVSDLNGRASGVVKIKGTTNQPMVNGYLDFQPAYFTVDYLQTRYSFADKVYIENNDIVCKNINVGTSTGVKSGSAILSGKVKNNYFKDFFLDLNLQVDNMHVLNTRVEDNDLFYGDAYVTGVVSISGKPDNIFMDVSATTEENTALFLPLYHGKSASESGFIQFQTEIDADENQEEEYNVQVSGIELNFDLEVTPDAEVQLIYDPLLGDVMNAVGEGNLKLNINPNGDLLMFGDYQIQDGGYLFTLQNVINKKLEIAPGGRILWNGDVYDAQLDVTTVYKTKANLKSLGTIIDDEYNKRVTVHCEINLTGTLFSPDLNFDISLPQSEEAARNQLRNAINTEEEKSKQFVALLVLNNFLPSSIDAGGFGASTGPNIANVSVSEMLTNQLNQMLSKVLGDNIDLGISEWSQNEVQVALSTQLFNDRVTINANVGRGSTSVSSPATGSQTGSTDVVGGSPDNGGTQPPPDDASGSGLANNNLVGDFDMEVKLDKKGRFKLRAFNRSNENYLYENSPYTQGVGIFYRREFDQWFKKKKKD